MKRLDGEVAIIAGGSGDMGSSISKLFLHEGANVMAGDIRPLKTKSSSNNKYEMNNSFLDFSYTYEQDWTATAGYGFVTGGSGEITLDSSGTKYQTSDVSGFGLFGIFGMEWGRIEGLVGLRYSSIKYSGFRSQNTLQVDSPDEPYPISGIQLIFGVGYNF